MQRFTVTRFILTFLLLHTLSTVSLAQRSNTKNDDVFVDEKGVMRWGKNKAEVHGFGINYTVPFAHAYRAAKQLNVSHREAIDNDVYHFARLGFDAYRVHVWDTEISDSLGNLLDNDHLQLFDYMLKKMKERGMKFILTPIAFWGNGYPEPDEKTPGFARKFGKGDCLTNEDAIQAQEKYLFQFLNHVNPHTGIAYKDDPDIIAFEVSNEPHHQEAPENVTTYINRMVASMRRTNCAKPIFYNISHSIHLVNAYFNAGIQGGTFQWYPTGLGAHEELGGNLLPNVDRYTVAFADNPKYKSSAKIVYEFDAADVGRSYIYPAMARSFRQAGIQWATHFAYDPTFMAYANTEYNTHFMNLVYAPQKALSLKLASEVFHKIPMYKDFGTYPLNARFDAFRVSYEEDLAEMITDKKFIYTNNTKSVVPAPEKLEEIAGYGNSNIVSYDGRGAYFLDRLQPGVWRLEVMPDAFWVKDPFGRNSLEREVAEVIWSVRSMTLSLPDIGENFEINAVNDGNAFKPNVQNKSFEISPGTYLIRKKGTNASVNGNDRWKNMLIKEFSAPKTTLKKTYVLHTPTTEITADENYVIHATVVSSEEPESVEVSVLAGFRPKIYPMEKVAAFTYEATIPREEVKEGFLRYFITVREKSKLITYPCGETGSPAQWNFDNTDPYQVNVVPSTSAVYLFDALTDNDELERPWNSGSSFAPASEPGKAEIRINVEKLFTIDPENPNGKNVHDYSMRYYFGKKIAGRKDDLSNKKEIVFRGRSLATKPSWIQVALITRQGTAFGGIMQIDAETKDYKLSFSDLKKVKLVTLPRPYPTFLSYYFENNSSEKFNVNELETLQISIGPGIPDDMLNGTHGVAVESVSLK